MKTKTVLSLGALILLGGCAGAPEKAPAEKLNLERVAYADLPGWPSDKQHEALPALLKSCQLAVKKKTLGWLRPCAVAKALPPGDSESARLFFEAWFIPHKISNHGPGLFTGYYEASLKGSKKRGGAHQTPLYAKPDDLLVADLGLFRESLKGQRLIGKPDRGRFVPYDDRAAIAAGALQGRAKPLYWVKDPVEAFFLEIQGSGRIELPDGKVERVGYEAQNGHVYIPIGRVLADQGEIERPVSMQKIRAWLAANPQRAQAVMNKNPSAIFFRKLETGAPVGAQGVELTPLRSLAVDPRFIPLGMPLWLVTPEHRRLVVAQDTGGAIKGPVRGDLFWGAGPCAEKGAGEMQQSGTYYLLLPKETGLP